MRPADLPSPAGDGRSGQFAMTRWTLVLTAANAQDVTQARRALAELCQTYWYPLYAYVRRRGYNAADAEDLTQGFFTRLLQQESLATVQREKGKFRSFLLAALNHYLATEWDRAAAQKRDVRRTISLDAQDAETRYGREPADHLTPEKLYDRQWALALLDRVLGLLEAEFSAAGRAQVFRELKIFLTEPGRPVAHAAVAAKLDLSESAVKVAVHRLRRHYRELLRAEIAQTVASAEQVEEELRALFAAFSA